MLNLNGKRMQNKHFFGLGQVLLLGNCVLRNNFESTRLRGVYRVGSSL